MGPLASLLFYFLATILKNSELEHEQLVIYKIFLEGINYMPDVFPIVFDQIKEKLSQVMANSQNPEILATTHGINHEIFSRTLTASYSAATANQTLQNLGYLGLQGSDQFNPKTKKRTNSNCLFRFGCDVGRTIISPLSILSRNYTLRQEILVSFLPSFCKNFSIYQNRLLLTPFYLFINKQF